LIVDFHCHAGQGEAMTAPWTTDAPLRPYLRRARAAGIGRIVLVPTFPADSRVANRALAALVRRDPARFVGFAWVHPRRDARHIDELVEEAVRLGLRGLKVHGSEATPTRSVCRAAQRHGLPVLVDVVSRPWTVEMFATRFPRVNFVLAHLGSFSDDWRAHQTVIDQLVRLPNVYADTSGVRRFDYLIEAVRRASPRKLLFGTDGPWLHPQLELQKVRLMRLGPEAEALILGGNAVRLIGPAVRPRGGSLPLAVDLRDAHDHGRGEALVGGAWRDLERHD
jgi:uncharacterized protein